MKKIAVALGFLIGLNTTLGGNETSTSAPLKDVHIMAETMVSASDYYFTKTSTGFSDKSAFSYVELGFDVNQQAPICPNCSWELTVKVEADFFDRSGTRLGQPIVKNLRISYNSIKGNTARIKDFVDMAGAYSVNARVISVNSKFFNGTTESPSTAALGTYLSATTAIERYYDLDVTQQYFPDATSLSHTYNTNSNQLEITWSRVKGAEDYELEYTYIDDFKDKSDGLLKYDFRNNATRVVLKDNSYAIAMMYNKGYFLYRLRAVGRTGTDFKIPVYGLWSGSGIDMPQGNVASFSPDHSYYITANPQLKDKNWQYSAAFAEEGKKKDNVTYFDGTLKPRQSQTIVNTNKELVVGETIYDHVGRPVIQTLPSPIPPAQNQGNLYYKSGVTMFNANTPYSKAHFDIGSGCAVNPLAMDSISGANQYYSSLNPVKDKENAYIPKAKGFAFSQVEYMDDNTGRVSRQSGVGKDHKLGSGHETFVKYEDVQEGELDKLFGNDVGFAKHYKKTITKDPNGQYSVSYTDLSGKVVATMLTADAPAQLTTLESNTGTATEITDVILNHTKLYDPSSGSNSSNANVLSDRSLTVNHSFAVLKAGKYKFEYRITPEELKNLKCKEGNEINLCYECVYDLQVTITNVDCQQVIYDSGIKSIGNLFETCSDAPKQAYDLGVADPTFKEMDLTEGSYVIKKVLTVNKPALDAQLKDYLEKYTQCTNEFTTPQKEKDKIKDNYICESEACKECELNLGTTYEQHQQLNGADAYSRRVYFRELQECRDRCGKETNVTMMYQQMLADVSPTGQYGCKSPDSSCFTLSVYNEYNRLSKNLSALMGNWRKPMYNFLALSHPDALPKGLTTNDSKKHYFNEFGEISVIPIQITQLQSKVQPSVADFSFEPEIYHVFNDKNERVHLAHIHKIRYVSNDLLVNGEVTRDEGQIIIVERDVSFGVIAQTVLAANEAWAVEAQDLQNLQDFIDAWEETWAASLVVNHPEFCYYEYLTLATQNKTTSFDYTSDEFDEAILEASFAQITSDAGINIGDFYNEVSRYTKGAKLFTAADAKNLMKVDFLLKNDPFFMDPIHAALKSDMLDQLSKYGAFKKDMRKVVASINRSAYNFHIPKDATALAYENSYFTNNGPAGTNINDPLDPIEFIEDDWDLYVTQYLALKRDLLKQQANNYCTSNGPLAVFGGNNSCIQAKEGYNPGFTSPHLGISRDWFTHYFIHPCGYFNYRLYKDKTKRYGQEDNFKLEEVGCEPDPQVQKDKYDVDHLLRTGQYPILRDLENAVDGLAVHGNLNQDNHAASNDLSSYTFLGSRSKIMGPDLYDYMTYGRPMSYKFTDGKYKDRVYKWLATVSAEAMNGGSNAGINHNNRINGKFVKAVGSAAPNFSCGEVTLTIPENKTYTYVVSSNDDDDRYYYIPLSFEKEVTVKAQDQYGTELSGFDKVFKVTFTHFFNAKFIGMGASATDYKFMGKGAFEITENNKFVGSVSLTLYGNTCIPIDGSQDRDLSNTCADSPEKIAIAKLLSTMAYTKKLSCNPNKIKVGTPSTQDPGEQILHEFYDPILNKYLYNSTSNLINPLLDFKVICSPTNPCPNPPCGDVPPDFVSEEEDGDFDLVEVGGTSSGGGGGNALLSPVPPSANTEYLQTLAAEAIPEDLPAPPPPAPLTESANINDGVIRPSSNIHVEFPATRATDDPYMNLDLRPDFSNSDFDEAFQSFNLENLTGFTCMEEGEEPNTFYIVGLVYNPATGKVNKIRFAVNLVIPANLGGYPNPYANFQFKNCAPIKRIVCDNDPNKNREHLEAFLNEIVGDDNLPDNVDDYDNGLFKNAAVPLEKDLSTVAAYDEHLRGKLLYRTLATDVRLTNQGIQYRGENVYPTHLQVVSVKNTLGVADDAGSQLEAQWIYRNGSTIYTTCKLSLAFDEDIAGLRLSHITGIRNLKASNGYGKLAGNYEFTATAVYYKNGEFGTTGIHGSSCLPIENCDYDCADGGYPEFTDGNFDDPTVMAGQRSFGTDYIISYKTPHSGATEVLTKTLPSVYRCSNSKLPILKDHTGGGLSHFLVVDGDDELAFGKPKRAWYKNFSVANGKTYTFEAYVANPAGFGCDAPIPAALAHQTQLATFQDGSNKALLSFGFVNAKVTVLKALFTLNPGAGEQILKGTNSKPGTVQVELNKTSLPASVNIVLETKEYGSIAIEGIFSKTAYQGSAAFTAAELPESVYTSAQGTYTFTNVPATCMACPEGVGLYPNNPKVELYYNVDGERNVIATLKGTQISAEKGWVKLSGVFEVNWNAPYQSNSSLDRKNIEIGLQIASPYNAGNVIAIDDIALRSECGTRTEELPPFTTISPCEATKEAVAEANAVTFNTYVKQQAATNFINMYMDKCLRAAEDLLMIYNTNNYHYTLYYYDQAGNLTMTVPPQGVRMITDPDKLAAIAADRINDAYQLKNQPQHKMKTTYRFNSMNQTVTQSLPDHEQFNIWQVSNPNTGDAMANNLNIKDIDFANQNKAVALANNASGFSSIYLTQDGAKNWSAITKIGIKDVNAAQFIDEDVVYAVGNEGKLLVSNDKGNTWDIYNTETDEDLVALYFSAEDQGFVVTKSGKVWAYNPTPYTAAFEDWEQATAAQETGTVQELVHTGNGESYITFKKADGKGVLYKLLYNNGTWTWTDVAVKPTEQVNVARMINGKLYAGGNNGLFMTLDPDVPGDKFALQYLNSNYNIVDIFGDPSYNGRIYIKLNNGMVYVRNAATESFSALSTQAFMGLVSSESGITADGKYFKRSGTNVLSAQETVTANITRYDPVNKTALMVAGGSSFVNMQDLNHKLSNTFTFGEPIVQVLLKPVEFGTPPKTKGFTGAVVTTTKVFNIVENQNLGALNPSGVSFSKYSIPVDASRTAGLVDDFQKLFALGNDQKIYKVTFGKGSIGTAGASVWKDLTGSNLDAIWSISYDEQGSDQYLHIVTAAGVYQCRNSGALTGPMNYHTPSLNGLSEKLGNKLIAAAGNSMLVTADLAASTASVKYYGSPVEFKDVALESDGSTLAIGTTQVMTLSATGIADFLTGTPSVDRLIPQKSSTELTDFVMVGDEGIYLKTSSGIAKVTTSSNKLKNIAQSPTAYTQLVVGENGTILNKIGTSNWTNATKIDALQLSKIALVPGTQIYYAVGKNGTLLKSTDQGSTWSSLKSAYTTQFNCIALSADGIGYVGGNNGKLYKLYDDELSLVTAGPLSTITANYTDIAYSTGSYVLSTASGALVYSLNAGTTWQTNTTLTQKINALAFSSENFVYAAGNAGTLAKLDLKTQTLTVLQTTTGSNWTSANLNDIYFVDFNTGHAIGDNGVLLKTLNRGETWLNKSDPALAGNLVAISAVSGNQLFIANQNGTQPGVQVLNDQADKISQRFWYDKVGRIVASQNTKQYKEPQAKYSYTAYDALGRPYEGGEVQTSALLALGNNLSSTDFMTWLNTSNNTRYEVSRTYFNKPQFNLHKASFTQENLINRVASVTYQVGPVVGDVQSTYQQAQQGAYDQAYHYSYDIHGNVNSMITENTLMGSLTGHAFKRMDYDYDLLSGKVNEVTYQAGEADMFKHRYTYDADNRLVAMYTSRDGLRWENDASYSYYRHGPLARTELGAYKVQGMDYAYTIQGWIKGVNSGTLQSSRDMGKDGFDLAGGQNNNFAPDEFGYTLGYYQGDYNDIASLGDASRFFAVLKGQTALDNKNLYNGNISNMTTAIAEFARDVNTAHKPTFLSMYQYDQLQRIKQVNKYFSSTLAQDNTWENATAQLDFAERFTYDANGNITFASRNGKSYHAQDASPANECTPTIDGLDKLTYKYHNQVNGYLEETNKLRWVDELAYPTANTGDLEDQNKDNYTYDAIGNLIKDTKDEIALIDWNVSGKVKSVQRTSGSAKPNLEFGYDASGQRAYKKVNSNSGGPSEYTFYVRDAQGNVMGHYQYVQGAPKIVLTELPIYGSQRVGMLKVNQALNPIVNAPSDVYTPYDAQNTSHVLLEGNNTYTLGAGTVAYVLEGSTFTGNLVLNANSSLVVLGTAEPSSFMDNGANAIKNMGTLKLSSTTLSSTVNFLNWGNFTATNDLTINSTSTFSNRGALKVQGNLNFGASVGIENTGSMEVQGNLYMANTNNLLENMGVVSVGQSLEASSNCEIYMYGGATMLLRSLNLQHMNFSSIGSGAELQVAGNATLGAGVNMNGELNFCVKGTLSDPAGGINSSVQLNACSQQNLLGPGQQNHTITLGDKAYELSNHLGNVLVTITDKKVNLSNSGWLADVASATDYYAFGASLRSSGTYRYGYQGQEKDSEWSDDYAFLFRMHDPRLGRFLSIDPLVHDYPHNSPYAFSENRVNDGVELEGAEFEPLYDKQFNVVGAAWKGYDKDENGNYVPKFGTVEHVSYTEMDGTEILASSYSSDGKGYVHIDNGKFSSVTTLNSENVNESSTALKYNGNEYSFENGTEGETRADVFGASVLTGHETSISSTQAGVDNAISQIDAKASGYKIPNQGIESLFSPEVVLPWGRIGNGLFKGTGLLLRGKLKLPTWGGNFYIGNLKLSIMSRVTAPGMVGHRVLGINYGRFTAALDYHSWTVRSGAHLARGFNPINEKFWHYHWGAGNPGGLHKQLFTGVSILDRSDLSSGIFGLY